MALLVTALAWAAGGSAAPGREAVAEHAGPPPAAAAGRAADALRVAAVYPVGAGVWALAEERAGSQAAVRILTRAHPGAAWEDVTPAAPERVQEPPRRVTAEFDHGRAWLAVVPRRPRHAVVVLATADGGKTWRRTAVLVADLDVDQVFLDFWTPEDGRLLVVSGGRGELRGAVYATMDGGRTWERWGAVSLPSAARGPGVTGPEPDLGDAGGGLAGLGFADAFAGWLVAAGAGLAPGRPGPLFTTRDGGATWSPQPLPAPGGVRVAPEARWEAYPPRFDGLEEVPLRGVLPVQVREPGGRHRVVAYVTDDLGARWHPAAAVAVSGEPAPLLAFTDRSGVILDRAAGVIHRLEDVRVAGPVAWRRVAPGIPLRDAQAIALGVEGTLWALLADGRLLRSPDGGQRWEDATPEAIPRTARPVVEHAPAVELPDRVRWPDAPLRGPLRADQVAAAVAAALRRPGVDPRTLLETLAPEGSLPYAAADLDGDGVDEVVAAVNARDPAAGWPRGTLLVISRRDGAAAVHHVPASSLPKVRLHAVADVTGDGLPEIVWSTTEPAAHSPPTWVWVSRWRAGRLERLPGIMRMRSLHDADSVRVERGEVVLEGGVVGSAGAGPLQRPRTDRYRWLDGRMRLVDRRFQPSAYGYFHLIDGLVAESVGRWGDAERHYRAALEPGRPVLPTEIPLLEEAGKAPVLREHVDAAIRAFARFRLVLLLLREGRAGEAAALVHRDAGPFAALPSLLYRHAARGGADLDRACAEAVAWAERHPGFLAALDALPGYAAPRWTAGDLCAPGVPGLED